MHYSPGAWILGVILCREGVVCAWGMGEDVVGVVGMGITVLVHEVWIGTKCYCTWVLHFTISSTVSVITWGFCPMSL